ncbi:MAG TPA: protein kinase [Micromonosporaceae bacterium]|jgi:serine/threonine-protein kinase|nr:protein kinase [Micromonosporaceae bacterium]
MSSWVVPGYTEIRDLGHGTTGRVALAWHDLTGTPVAIQYLNEMLRGDEPFLRIFRGLIRRVAAIDHPNVARVYEYVESGAGAAIVTELIDGVPLREMLAEGRFEPEAALAVVKGSLLGLAAAHSRGVVHGGYAPGRVLVDTEGRGKLIDFGVGSCPKAPPTARHDLDAVAKTLYECLVEEEAAGRILEPLRLLTGSAEPPATAEAFLAALDSAATAAYGADWEQRGRDLSASRAARLAAIMPATEDQQDPSRRERRWRLWC